MRKSGVLFLILMLVPLAVASEGGEPTQAPAEQPPSEPAPAGNQTGNQTGDQNSTADDELSGEESERQVNADEQCRVVSPAPGKGGLLVVVDPDDCFWIDNFVISLLP